MEVKQLSSKITEPPIPLFTASAALQTQTNRLNPEVIEFLEVARKVA